MGFANIWNGSLLPGIFGGVLGAFFALLVCVLADLLTPRRKCPDCEEKLPRLRGARTWKQTFLGRKTCSKCGCEIRGDGRRIRAGRMHDIATPE